MGKSEKRPAHEVIVDRLSTLIRNHTLLTVEGESMSMVRGKIDVLLEILHEMVLPRGCASDIARALRILADRGSLREDISHNLKLTADTIEE